ncbi:MAG: sodium:proton antiporter [Alphaproteobacteria bacterium]|nr:sodium:proton antiporter [Alphaproteobacteria bacterium]MCY4317617.1 sodium:proton antiporter [Alphaproteobacteria bacterium]
MRVLAASISALLFGAGPALAAGAGAPHLDGGGLGLIWCVPFVGILLSIALFPLLAPAFWHHHFGKVSAFWAFAFLLPFLAVFGWELTLFEILHVGLLEYIPFIILLLSLFTVAGGIRLTGRLVGTPVVNTGILLLGTVLASWMGTTGAAMLLIRPIIRANEWRRYKVHTMVFFIFLVANIGGSLTPLGDPPLFLGFLKGVDFFWPTGAMLVPMLLVSTLLLVLYYGVDSLLYRRETGKPVDEDEGDGERLGLSGKVNFLLLAGVVAAVLMSGVWRPGVSFDVFHVTVELQNLCRDLLLLAIAWISWVVTDRANRDANGFSWFPILEVAKLFAGIFLTIVPAIAILRAGTSGALEPVVSLVTGADGRPDEAMYFWLTGILSSFLDNAPTYLVFFNTAGGDAQELMGPLYGTLLAISAGAVFMGANTYIGNAPNFMVRAICEERGIAMPSFFGYMVWSVGILAPIFLLVTLVFFP